MGIFRRKKKNRIDTSEYPDDNVLKIDELFVTPHSEENKTENISGDSKPDIVQERVDSEKNIAGNPSLRKQYVENCCSQMVEAEKRIDEVLQIVSLANTGKKKVGQFSLGMKQRLGIAMALLNRPKL